MSSTLILAPFFPPYSPSPGWSVRVLTLSHFLRESGFAVHVLASKGAYRGFAGNENLVKLPCTHFVEHPSRVRFEQQKKSSPGGGTTRQSGLQSFLEEIAIPDREMRILPPMLVSAYRLIKRNRIQNLVTSSPPHSCHVIGLLLKWLLGRRLNWIVDYRDSWNSNPKYAKKSSAGQALSLMLERQVLRTCDYFTFVSLPMLHKLKGLSPGLERKARLVMNGYWEAPTPGNLEPPTGRPCRIGHFGYLDPARQSLAGLAAVLNNTAELKGELEFHFIGGPPDIEHPDIRLSGSLEHSEALKHMTTMDYLLFVYSDPETSDEVVSGKLFEYFAAQRPVLCLAPEQTEARRLVQKLGLGLVADPGNPMELRQALQQIRGTDWNRIQETYRALPVERFHRSEQYKVFLEILRA